MQAESNIELFGTLSTVCFVIAIVAFLLAAFFFFYFDIPTVFALKTGRAKKKTLERIQQQNSYTDKIRKEAQAAPVHEAPSSQHVIITNPDETNKRNVDTVALNDSADTSLLQNETETALLKNEAETSLLKNDAETALLSSRDGETSLLNGASDLLAGAKPSIKDPSWQFELLEETVMIHTKELI